MPFNAFKRIHGTAQPKKINAKLNIRDAGGNDLGYQGTYLLPMQLIGKKIMPDIVVLENLQDNIIGIDCINKHFLGYSAYKQSPVWETPPIDSARTSAQQKEYTWTPYLRKLSRSNARMNLAKLLDKTQQ